MKMNVILAKPVVWCAKYMESFSFVLNMKLMLKVFHITNELSLLFQRKDQNIVESMSLLVDVKAHQFKKLMKAGSNY